MIEINSISRDNSKSNHTYIFVNRMITVMVKIMIMVKITMRMMKIMIIKIAITIVIVDIAITIVRMIIMKMNDINAKIIMR